VLEERIHNAYYKQTLYLSRTKQAIIVKSLLQILKMSRSIKSNKRVSPEAPKPFCKVCQDAGKSPEIVQSHFVKDLQGKVICPTLLSQECRYCFKLGHTVKFCPILADQAKEEKREEARIARIEAQRQEEEKKKTAPKSKPTSKNVFAALDDSSDEEEVRVAKPVVTKPVATKKSQLPPPKQATLIIQDEFPALSAARKESEFPALSPNVTLRPHQRAFAQEATVSYAATLQMPVVVKAAPIPYLKTVIKKEEPKKAVVTEEWSDDEEYIEAQLAAKEPPKPLYKLGFNWADCDSDEDW